MWYIIVAIVGIIIGLAGGFVIGLIALVASKDYIDKE